MADAFTATTRVMDVLQAAGVPCAVGGSIAMQVSGFARATIDGDINVFVPMEEALGTFQALADAGFDVDPIVAARVAAERGDGRFYVEGVRVDLFFNSIPLHTDAARRTRDLWIGDAVYPALSPEDLVVLKALFNRGKDWIDITRIIAVMGTAFEAGYCRRQLVAHAGADDETVVKLGAILAEWANGEGA
jgi:Nucleotidyl transferase of unknown function (DUF2204)